MSLTSHRADAAGLSLGLAFGIMNSAWAFGSARGPAPRRRARRSQPATERRTSSAPRLPRSRSARPIASPGRRGRMQREDWDRRYAEVENLWATKPNRFLVAEVGGAPAGPRPRPRLRRGTERDLARLARLGRRPASTTPRSRSRRRRHGPSETASPCDSSARTSSSTSRLEASYDLVLVMYLHIPSTRRRAVHAKASAAVAPGGTFLLVGHDLTNLTDGVGGPSDPDILYTAEQIACRAPGRRDREGHDRPARRRRRGARRHRHARQGAATGEL